MRNSEYVSTVACFICKPISKIKTITKFEKKKKNLPPGFD